MINISLLHVKRSAFRRAAIVIGSILFGWPGSPALAAMPDLVPNTYRLKRTIEFKRRSIPRENCAFAEGCLRGLSTRKLLLFDTGVANVGKADLVIGNPTRRPNLFTFSPCHAHYHMNAFARYRLFNRNWRLVMKAAKQGFCLRDDRRHLPTGAPTAKYTCDYQGISSGWQDIYDKSLDCQWLDISRIPPGKYYLEVVVNPNRIFKEANYKNNKVIISITVPAVVN